MDVIDATRPFFIRCIKPNHSKAPKSMQTRMTVEQLT